MTDLTPYVECVRRHTADLIRRNAEATERARADLPRLVAVIASFPGIKRAYLFGSLAKGRFHPKADIDIAIQGLGWERLTELQRLLDAATSFEVDVRDLDATPTFRDLIEFYGELLHAHD